MSYQKKTSLTSNTEWHSRQQDIEQSNRIYKKIFKKKVNNNIKKKNLKKYDDDEKNSVSKTKCF